MIQCVASLLGAGAVTSTVMKIKKPGFSKVFLTPPVSVTVVNILLASTNYTETLRLQAGLALKSIKKHSICWIIEAHFEL